MIHNIIKHNYEGHLLTFLKTVNYILFLYLNYWLADLYLILYTYYCFIIYLIINITTLHNTIMNDALHCYRLHGIYNIFKLLV